MTADLVERLRTCTAEERKAIAMQILGHKYIQWGIDQYPTMFDDAHRRPGYETGDVTYAVLHPSQPYDDDSVLVRWNIKKDIWTMSFSLGIGGGAFPEGEPILGEDDCSERAALSLLAHFGLLERRSELHPAKIGYMSPYRLNQLASESGKTAKPNQ